MFMQVQVSSSQVKRNERSVFQCRFNAVVNSRHCNRTSRFVNPTQSETPITVAAIIFVIKSEFTG